MRTWVISLVAAVAAFGATGCSGGEDEDAGAFLACRGFRSVASDYDTLSADEVRDRLRDVYDDAKISELPAIREAGRQLMETNTSGSTTEQVDAVTAMGQACEAAGF